MMTAEQIAEQPPLPPRAEQEPLDSAAVRSQIADLEQHARTLIRQQPIVALLAAAGVGYLVARVIARGTR